MPLPLRDCIQCGAPFKPTRPHAVLCGDACRAALMHEQQRAWFEANAAQCKERRAIHSVARPRRVRRAPRPHVCVQPLETPSRPTPRRDKIIALSLAYNDGTFYRDVDVSRIWFREAWDE